MAELAALGTDLCACRLVAGGGRSPVAALTASSTGPGRAAAERGRGAAAAAAQGLTFVGARDEGDE